MREQVGGSAGAQDRMPSVLPGTAPCSAQGESDTKSQKTSPESAQVYVREWETTQDAHRPQQHEAQDAPFGESVWDVALLVGCTAEAASLEAADPQDPRPLTSWYQWSMGILLLVLNITIQILLSMAIYNSMTDNPYNDTVLTAMESRRLLDGHSAALASPSTGMCCSQMVLQGSPWEFELRGLRRGAA